MEYTLGEPSAEESTQVTEELKAVLEKYDCEMQVISTINILKRIYPNKEDIVIESPYNGTDITENKEENTESTTESSSTGGGEEPVK